MRKLSDSLNPKFLTTVGLSALIYWITADLGLRFASIGNTSPIWPASGVALGLLIWFGKKI